MVSLEFFLTGFNRLILKQELLNTENKIENKNISHASWYIRS